MKVFGALAAAVFGQGVEYCGPDAANGGAFWPGQSVEDPCGIHYVDKWVGANQKCTLTVQVTLYPKFILSLPKLGLNYITRIPLLFHISSPSVEYLLHLSRCLVTINTSSILTTTGLVTTLVST